MPSQAHTSRACASGEGDRIVDALDAAVADRERQALQVGDAAGCERRQCQRTLQGEPLIAHDLERQVQPIDQLALLVGRTAMERPNTAASTCWKPA